MNCPYCKKEIKPLPSGRPKKLNDSIVLALRKKEWSLNEIAKHCEVSKSAIQASLKRSQK